MRPSEALTAHRDESCLKFKLPYYVKSKQKPEAERSIALPIKLLRITRIES